MEPMRALIAQIIRFGISGGIATGLIVGLLYLFTAVFHWWYLLSDVIAFIIAIVVSFLLQKYWAFGDTRREGAGFQMTFYVFVMLWDLALNTGLLYLSVERLHLWYLYAQLGISVLIAIQNYLLYRFIIFRQPQTEYEVSP